MRISAGLPTGVVASLFDDAKRRRDLEKVLTAELESRGFREVLLPVLDYFEPYQHLLDRDRLRELYRFVDRDGHLLVLRGDFTPMIARLLAPQAAHLDLPLGVFYRGDVIRHLPARPGRLREYSQLGAEWLGESGWETDGRALETFLSLLSEAARESGSPPIEVVLGVAGALDQLLEGQLPPEKARAAVRALEVRDRESAREAGPAFVEIVENGLPRDLAALGEGRTAVEELCELRDRLATRFEEQNLHLTVDLAEFATATLLPQLEPENGTPSYYDGLVFRAYTPGAAQALGAGGRYDRLFRSLNADLPAVGFSLALDTLLQLGSRHEDLHSTRPVSAELAGGDS